MAIQRKSLRSQVRRELLARMRSGAVVPGEGINEVQLAAELGVSRTPLREALIALESEGQIESEDGKGFRFVPLRAREFEELAPIMATLEGLALKSSVRPRSSVSSAPG
ncbi:GntR family transcriptional regulator [Salana multivorans]